MKKLILEFLITAIALMLADYLIPGMTLGGSLEGFLLVTLVLMVMHKVVKPVLKLLSLPIEVATLGIFTVVINTFLLLVVDYLLTPLQITSFWFPGISAGPLLIAPMRIPAVLTAILASILISTVSTVLLWLAD